MTSLPPAKPTHDEKTGNYHRSTYSVSCPLLILTAGCFFVAFFMLNPGLMSYDSMVTWRMSGGAPMSNAHPPVYILLLMALRFLWDSPATMVFFNVGIFLFGCLLFGEAIRRRSPVLGYLIPLSVFLPFILNFIGVLWKDTALAVCWWASICIAIYVSASTEHKRGVGIGLMLIAYSLFLFGLLVRHNAITAAPFLLSTLIILHVGKPPALRRIIYIFLLSLVVSLGSLKISSMIMSHIYPITKIDMLNDLITYDLAGITKRSGENAFAVDFTDEEIQKIIQCYQLTDWNSYATPGRCLFVMNRHYEQHWYMGTKPLQFWIKSILKHPLAYAQHRLAVFGSFLRIGKSTSYAPAHHGIDPNELGLVHPEQPLFKAFQTYLATVENAFFMKPWFWLLLNIAGLIVLFQRRSEMINMAAIGAASAGTVYIVTYLPFGIASDFRYAYWSIMAAVFSWFVIASQFYGAGRWRQWLHNSRRHARVDRST